MFGLVRRLAVVVAIVAVVGLMFWAGLRNHRARQAAMQQKMVVLSKDGTGMNAMPGMDGAPTDANESTLQGKAAPGFSLVDVAGKKVSLADYKGRPVVINFWATYCGPCRLEMPWFEEFTAKYKDKGLVVLGVDQDEDLGKGAVADAAKKVGVTYPILMPDKTIAKNYDLGDYLPQTFYVSKSGVVVAEIVGARPKDEIEANVQKAIEE
jgi:thiol-disulfide isomerase/thioredoxin